MENDEVNSLQTHLTSLERKIAEYETCRGVELAELRSSFCQALSSVSGLQLDSGQKCSQLLDRVYSLNNNSSRNAALLLLRCLDVKDLFPPKEEDRDIELSVVRIVEEFLPDFVKKYELKGQKQTYQKFNQLRLIHKDILRQFDAWLNVPESIEGLQSNKKNILKVPNIKHVKSYLALYDLDRIRASINELFAFVETIADEDSEEFFDPLEKAQTAIAEHYRFAYSNPSFLTTKPYVNLLASFKEMLEKLEKGSSERFYCDIRPKKSGKSLAIKKYPLHSEGKEIMIRIPMLNVGPGVAKDVRVAYFDSEDGKVSINSESNLGDLRKGEFELAIEALVIECTESSTFNFIVTWRQQGSTDFKEQLFECEIEAQRKDVDWEELKYEEPYSTDVAEGDEFVGRKNKLYALVKRVLKPRMQSSYITGQKRIGKTSLALAVRNYISGVDAGKNVVTHYVEWGEVARPDPSDSVKALAENIFSFLEEYLSAADRKIYDFAGTLSPLNEVANKLLKSSPSTKFLIILDEFDEIHPQMYRYGNLAEAFFSNLRTLSSKKNMGFMLVGGENMPFVISAQGDQLNRFVHESLDYFSEASEYSDYELLIKNPSKDVLSWSEEAIRQLFHLTNGHPFYTKLICSEIFSSAVRERDSEITTKEVNSAIPAIIENLDVNCFAHHWRDGIQKTEEEAESISLNRCRCLVSMGRYIRDYCELTFDNICRYNSSTQLSDGEIRSILRDFERRNIIKELSSGYRFTVLFFREWLVNRGISILIADTLGDDFADEKAKEDEVMRVRSSEIERVVEKWHPYRGQEITSESVRTWINQVEDIGEQRLLFKLLQNVKFVSEIEIRDKLKTAHSMVRTSLPVVVQTSRRQSRRDILVAYIDGEAKSGQYFASRYAEENSMLAKSVFSSQDFYKKAEKYENETGVTVNRIVIVDDIAATGNSLSSNLEKFLSSNERYIRERSITIVVVVLICTIEAEDKIAARVGKWEQSGFSLRFRACELLSENHLAFSDQTDIWVDEVELTKARSLCARLGSYISLKQPLGYGKSGLLVVFPDRCPNNSLPILHGASNGAIRWKPLFPRPLN